MKTTTKLALLAPLATGLALLGKLAYHQLTLPNRKRKEIDELIRFITVEASQHQNATVRLTPSRTEILCKEGIVAAHSTFPETHQFLFGVLKKILEKNYADIAVGGKTYHLLKGLNRNNAELNIYVTRFPANKKSIENHLQEIFESYLDKNAETLFVYTRGMVMVHPNGITQINPYVPKEDIRMFHLLRDQITEEKTTIELNGCSYKIHPSSCTPSSLCITVSRA